MTARDLWMGLKVAERQAISIAVEARSINKKHEVNRKLLELAQYGYQLKEVLNPDATNQLAEMGLSRLLRMKIAKSEKDLII